jgi:hypothetical protein
MKIITVSGEKSKKPMRNILGMNNLPKISSKERFDVDKPRYDALNLGYIRFHDAPIENASFDLVDVSRIFPLFHLDESDERNYKFAQTDDYMSYLKGNSAEVDFRLGETIDHSGFLRNVKAPADADKWARICRNIIGHYKNGEMGGMHLNITRVSVWEEPDNSKLFDGTIEQYVELFCKTYKLLKRDFPDIKVGGPCSMSDTEYTDKFLTLCKKEGVVPDFTSNTMYLRTVKSVKEILDGLNEVRKKHGIENTEHLLTEWHYAPTSWKSSTYDGHGFETAEGAAFSASTLAMLMDLDYLSTAYYYSWATSIWAPYLFSLGGYPLYPTYYALLFFQKLATECERLAVNADLPEGAFVLAGKTADGRARVLISLHDCDDEVLRVEGLGADKAILKRITMDFNESDCTEGEQIAAADGAFEIVHKDRHGVYLLEA